LYYKEVVMQDPKEIRFVATNYYNLQGLRAVPLGLCLVVVCLWANGLKGAARGSDFLAPALCLAGLLTLLYAIDRYYLRAFGRVQRTPESRQLEWLVSVIGGILALGAFWLDISFKLPVSLVGLVFAAGLLADYIRITWLVKGRFLLYYPVGAILMAGVSVLPLLGVSSWWLAGGIKSQMIAIALAIGLFTIMAGVWGHIFLARTLPSRMETLNDHAI
jgi:hypothetical protein